MCLVTVTYLVCSVYFQPFPSNFENYVDFMTSTGLVVMTLGVRFDTVSSSDFAANFADFRQLVTARSRLYRSRFLQPNTHFAAFFEIYKIIIPLHRPEFKILANFRRKVFAIFKISSKKLTFFMIFIGFCTDFNKFSRNFAKICREC